MNALYPLFSQFPLHHSSISSSSPPSAHHHQFTVLMGSSAPVDRPQRAIELHTYQTSTLPKRSDNQFSPVQSNHRVRCSINAPIQSVPYQMHKKCIHISNATPINSLLECNRSWIIIFCIGSGHPHLISPIISQELLSAVTHRDHKQNQYTQK